MSQSHLRQLPIQSVLSLLLDLRSANSTKYLSINLRKIRAFLRLAMAQTSNGVSSLYTTTALNRWSVADKQLPCKISYAQSCGWKWSWHEWKTNGLQLLIKLKHSMFMTLITPVCL